MSWVQELVERLRLLDEARIPLQKGTPEMSQRTKVERQLNEQEADEMEKRANTALANNRVIEARRLFRIADALRTPSKRRHDA